MVIYAYSTQLYFSLALICPYFLIIHKIKYMCIGDSRQPIDPNIINTKQCLFVDNYLSKSLYKMIQFNYLLTHWVSAEILMMDNLKVNLI